MLGTSARFSASVRPVTVRQSPCSNPASSSARSTAGVPPTRCRSYMTYRPPGFRSARCGTFAAEPVEVGQRPLDPGLAGDGHQVQHGVGRAAQGQHERVGVLQRLAGDDVARAGCSFSMQPHQRLAGQERLALLGRRHGRVAGVVGQRQAHRLDGAGHGVGGVHAAARAAPGAALALDLVELLRVDACRPGTARPPRRWRRCPRPRRPARRRAGCCRRRRRRSGC